MGELPDLDDVVLCKLGPTRDCLRLPPLVEVVEVVAFERVRRVVGGYWLVYCC